MEHKRPADATSSAGPMHRVAHEFDARARARPSTTTKVIPSESPEFWISESRNSRTGKCSWRISELASGPTGTRVPERVAGSNPVSSASFL